MKKKTTTILIFSLFATCSFASNITDPFWQQAFNAGLPGSWTIGDESGQGVLWERCENPYTCLPNSITSTSCRNDEFRSNGFEDGFMFVNSIDHGQLPNNSISYLQSEQIDCTDKSKVFIQFQTYIHAADINSPTSNAVLRVKSGNGPWTTYTVFPYLNPASVEKMESWNPETVLIDISAAAANKPNITIEWNWTANSDVTWMLDDVALFDVDPQVDNVVWGLTQGNFSGGLNGWSVTVESDTCRWRWKNTGLAYLPTGGAKADFYACWPGAENGAMLMNASPCSLPGLNTQYSKSDLLSPTINLSGVNFDTKLNLKYNQAFAVANAAPFFGLPITSVAVSIDNGQSYIDTIDVNSQQPWLQGKCEEVSVRLPGIVAGKPQVRLKFMFAGDTHFWMVDNVRITYANDQDMVLNPAFYNISPDFKQPKNQLRPIRLFAQIKNAGNSIMEDVKVLVEVKNNSNFVVFKDSLEFGMVEPSDTWLDVVFPNKFLPEPQVGNYQIFYRVKSSTPDQTLSNNSVHWDYEVTEGVFAKNDFCKSNVGYFLPTDSYDYEIGNCYYVQKGSGLKASSVSFAYRNTGNLAAANAVLSINLYQWKKGSNMGDANGDTIANADEFELIAYNAYNASADDRDMVVTVPVSGEMDSVDLADSTYYFVTIGYLDPVAIGGTIMPFPIAGSEEFNYGAMFYNSYEDGIPAFTSMLREGDETYFRANAWALRRIPFINLNVVQYVSDTYQPFQKRQNLAIAPNPANETIQISCDFVSHNQPTQVEIFDICGRLALRREFQNGFVSQMPIDVSRLSNGSYTLRVISGANTASRKLVVTH